MEEALLRYGDALKVSVDAIDRSVNNFQSNSVYVSEEEKFGAFFSRLEELTNGTEFCMNRLKQSGPSLEELVRLGREKMKANQTLLDKLQGVENLANEETYTNEPSPLDEVSTCGPESSSPYSSQDSPRSYTYESTKHFTPKPKYAPDSIASPASSDPPTPKLEDFGIENLDFSGDEENCEVDLHQSSDNIKLDGPKSHKTSLVTSDEAKNLPLYLLNQMNHDSINRVLLAIGEIFGTCSFSVDDLEQMLVEKLEETNPKAKACILALIKLNRLNTMPGGLYILV